MEPKDRVLARRSSAKVRRLEFTCELDPTPTGRIQSNIDTKVGARSTPSGRAAASMRNARSPSHRSVTGSQGRWRGLPRFISDRRQQQRRPKAPRFALGCRSGQANAEQVRLRGVRFHHQLSGLRGPLHQGQVSQGYVRGGNGGLLALRWPVGEIVSRVRRDVALVQWPSSTFAPRRCPHGSGR